MDGMDMGSSSTMTGMVNYLHFSPTSDPLWFKEWAPSSSGAMVGACIGLFIFAIIERLLHGIGGIMEAWWHKRFVFSDRKQNLRRAYGRPYYV